MTPATSVLTQIVQGLGELAQGETQKGVVHIVPAFLKRGVNTAFNKMKFGDYTLRGSDSRPLMEPNPYQLGNYLAGFNQSRLSEAQRLNLLEQQSEKRYQDNQNRQKDEAAVQLLRGNHQPVQQLSQQALHDNPHLLMTDPTAPMRSIADRAAELRQPFDPLASMPVGNSKEALAIAQTFPSSAAPRRSEVQSVRDKTVLQAQTGSLPSKVEQDKAMTHAMMVDHLVAKGMLRSQAERAVMMLGF
jgi:hypothetical protein